MHLPNALLAINHLLCCRATVQKALGTEHFVNIKMPTTYKLTDALVNNGIGHIEGRWHFDIHKMIGAQRPLERSSTR
jgi:hypothetical protein